MDLSTAFYYNIVVGTPCPLIRDPIPAKLNQSYPSQETFMVIPNDFTYNYQINPTALPTDGDAHQNLSKYFWANYKRDKNKISVPYRHARHPDCPSPPSMTSFPLLPLPSLAHILCRELVSKRGGAWVLHYVRSAYAITDTLDQVWADLS